MELIIVFLPLFCALALLFVGRYLGFHYATLLATGGVATSLLLSLFSFFKVGFLKTITLIPLLSWMIVGDLSLGWSFCVDPLISVMFLVILSISLFVHLYSMDYMSEDPHKIRFFSYLSLFTFFMLLLVSSANFVQLFVGWEGVGVCSYLLINFWFTRKQANKSALKAMVVNRIGDFGLLIAMFLIYNQFKSLDFSVVFPLVPSTSEVVVALFGSEYHLLSLISVAILIGAAGKSAQLGLHTWLPDAMEGPTPVSALIHAATMVTAGVFLLVRCSPILEFCPTVLSVVAILGALTAFFGATVGLFQNDLKRVVAYSTCSQLGYMVFCCGNSAYSTAMFHLYNHAFFKALLFLGAGAVIHAYSDEQDMRRMGGLASILPLSYAVILIGSLSLMGFPFLTGFYSKDLILEVAASSPTLAGAFSYWLGVISAFFTSFYSLRLLYLTFLSPPRGPIGFYRAGVVHEAPRFMVLSLVPLAILSIFAGYFSRELFVSLGTDFWGYSIFLLPSSLKEVDSEFLGAATKLVPLLFSLMGGLVSLLLHLLLFNRVFIYSLLKEYRPFYLFLNRRWFFDKLSNELVVKPGFKFGYQISFKLLDRGFIEQFGPKGVSNFISLLSTQYSKVHSGYLYHYLFLMVGGLSLILFLLLFPTSPLILKGAVILFILLVLFLF